EQQCERVRADPEGGRDAGGVVGQRPEHRVTCVVAVAAVERTEAVDVRDQQQACRGTPSVLERGEELGTSAAAWIRRFFPGGSDRRRRLKHSTRIGRAPFGVESLERRRPILAAWTWPTTGTASRSCSTPRT